MKPHPAVPKPAATIGELLEEMRTLAMQESPQRAAVDRAFAAAAALLKSEPRQAPLVLRKSLPLVMHAMTHVQRGAAEGVLKLLDLAAALPDDVIDEAMPVLAQLLDFSIGKWSFSQSTYRFARFPRLRQRILDAALEMAVAERNHTNPAVAVMALHDVIQGLQKCNAFDEPQVADAFARYAIGQSNADVQRAVVAYLLEDAPHVVARVLDSRPELFPCVEDLHVYRGEQRGHLVDVGPHDKRVAGLGKVPVAHIELFLLDDSAAVAQRMAAAMAVPHIADQAARARLLPRLRRMLDEDTMHVGIVEGQTGSPEHFWTRAVALPVLTKILEDVNDPKVALEALHAALPRNTVETLLPLARACDRGEAVSLLAGVVALHPEKANVRYANVEATTLRWLAFRVLCSITDDIAGHITAATAATAVTAAAAALAHAGTTSTTADRRAVTSLLLYMPEALEKVGAGPLTPMLRAWPSLLALTDVAHSLRTATVTKVKQSKHAAALAPHIAEAERVLVETAKLDKPLAEALLISPL